MKTLFLTTLLLISVSLHPADPVFQEVNPPADNNRYGESMKNQNSLRDRLSATLNLPVDLTELNGLLQEMGSLDILELTGKDRSDLQAVFTQDDLVESAGKGLLNSLWLLFFLGFDINWLNNDSFSPLLIASRNGHYDVVEYLLQIGADIEKADADGLTPLRYAVLFEHHETAELLLQRGAQVNRRDRYRWTPLLSAVANNDPLMVELLLKYGADPELKTRRGEYPLIESIYQGNHEIASSLLENGANPDVRDIRYDYPALFIALAQKNNTISSMLIKSGADLTLRGNRFGETALMTAVRMEMPEIVELLLDNGAPVNDVDNKGWTSLFYALERVNLQITNILLKHKIDRELSDNNGKTAEELWGWKLDQHLLQLLNYQSN